MVQYVVVEDKHGVEFKGSIETDRILEEDQLVTVKTYRGTYVSGFIVELLGEKHDKASN